jgi:hypothetical protein
MSPTLSIVVTVIDRIGTRTFLYNPDLEGPLPFVARLYSLSTSFRLSLVNGEPVYFEEARC